MRRPSWIIKRLSIRSLVLKIKRSVPIWVHLTSSAARGPVAEYFRKRTCFSSIVVIISTKANLPITLQPVFHWNKLFEQFCWPKLCNFCTAYIWIHKYIFAHILRLVFQENTCQTPRQLLATSVYTTLVVRPNLQLPSLSKSNDTNITYFWQNHTK